MSRGFAMASTRVLWSNSLPWVRDQTSECKSIGDFFGPPIRCRSIAGYDLNRGSNIATNISGRWLTQRTELAGRVAEEEKKSLFAALIGRKKFLLGFQIREDLLWHVFNRENEFSELICCIVVCVLFGTLWDAAGNDFSRVKMVLEFGCKEASNIIGTDEQGNSFSTI